MSQVTHVCKCDRCGALYETGGKTPVLAIKYTVNSVTKNIDLCPVCTDSVLEMMMKTCPKKPSDILEENHE